MGLAEDPEFISSIVPQIGDRVSSDGRWEGCESLPPRWGIVESFDDIILESISWLNHERLPFECHLVALEVHVADKSDWWKMLTGVNCDWKYETRVNMKLALQIIS